MPRLLEQVSSRCCPSRDRGGGRDVWRREGAPAAWAGAAGLCSAEEGSGWRGSILATPGQGGITVSRQENVGS